MPSVLRTMAFLAGVCVLYVVGYAAMSATPAPWGFAWLLPLAVVGGMVWYAVERLDAHLRRKRREQPERGQGGAPETPPGSS